MGILIKNNSILADYSASGLGKYISFVQTYFTAGGITTTKQKTAVTNLYNSMKTAGLWDKFDVIKLRGFGIALADSINLKSPSDFASRSVFSNDDVSAHNANGYTSSASPARSATTTKALPATMSVMHIHAYNSTPESATDGVMYGVNDGNGASGTLIYLCRKLGGVTKSQIGATNTAIATGYNTAKTGLLSASLGSSTQKLYDAGILLSTVSAVPSMANNSGVSLAECSFGSAGLITNSSQMFCGYGVTAWLDSDETALNTIVQAYVTQMA